MEQSLHKYVLKNSPRETTILILLTLLSLPIYYLSLDIPKNIFNQGILGKGITFPHTTIGGYTFEQVGYLFVLCVAFFISVLVNGGLKQYINTYKGRLGERLLRRLRYDLVSRILRFPLPHFRKVSSAELIPMVTAEVEPLGGYFGDAFAQPLIQAGTLGTIVAFLFIQNPIMGLAAISLYPIQGFIIPRMQKRVNQLGKERVRAMRKVSERIGEAVAGAQEVHANGAVVFERADFSDRLGKVFDIRFQIYLRKGQVKFLNNFLNQMAPLLFYSIGGYLVIQGDLTAGALAAALTANKDMSAPWKELLDYYQQTADSKIKYEQVTEQFRPENMFDEALQAPAAEPPPRLNGDIVASSLAIAEDGQSKLLENVNFTIKPGEKIAVVGRISGGKEAAALALARLYLPSGGKLTLAGNDAASLPETTVGARIAYAAQNAYLFSASVRDNLIYSLRQRVVAPRERDGKAAAERALFLAETRRAGNLDLDIEAEWLDLSTAGVADEAALSARIVEVLKAADVEDDIFQLGLRGTIDPKSRADVAARVLEARRALLLRIGGAGADPVLASFTEPFHPDRYNSNASLAENLLFGTPIDPSFEVDKLASNPHILAVLDGAKLTDELVGIGRQVAETMVEIFADLPPGHEFFEQFSFISSDDLKEFQALLARTAKASVPEIIGDDRARLLTLPFKLVNARHRLGLIDDKLQGRIVEARKALRDRADPAVTSGVAFFDPEAYNAASSIQDNILFGKLAYGQAKAAVQIGKLIEEVLDELKLRAAVIDLGLDFQVGIGGARLVPPQRQKLILARCLLKRPDLLVINEATAVLDVPAQNRTLEGILRDVTGTLVWVLHNPAHAEKFDRVMVFGDGRLVETGSFAELQQKSGGAFAELLATAS